MMIRSPLPTDLLSIGHVYCTAWKAAYSGIIPDDYLNQLTDENCSPRSVRTEGALVCEEGGKIIGVVSFGSRRDAPQRKEGEISSIYVLPEYWRTGTGRALFEAAAEQLHASGYDALFLWALTENTRAVRFYERMGMAAVDSRTITIGGRELSETGYLMPLPADKQNP